MFKVGDIVRGRKDGWDLDGCIGKIAHAPTYNKFTDDTDDDMYYVNFERHGSFYVFPDILVLEKAYMRSIKLNQILK